MNAQNSTAHRLKRKLAILDFIDDRSGSDKLDLIIQLPYTIKSEAKRAQAKDVVKNLLNNWQARNTALLTSILLSM